MKTFDSFQTILKRPDRCIIATMLTVIYMMISLSPFASFAMNSIKAGYGLTVECSGDCNTCGCPAESRANRSCCCSKKRQQQLVAHEDKHNGPDCCKKPPVKKKTVIASCGSPCGSGEQIALSASDSSELLPVHFTKQFSLTHTDTSFTNPKYYLKSRHDDPPDPPPKLSALS
jgi:hypothetical protein